MSGNLFIAVPSLWTFYYTFAVGEHKLVAVKSDGGIPDDQDAWVLWYPLSSIIIINNGYHPLSILGQSTFVGFVFFIFVTMDYTL